MRNENKIEKNPKFTVLIPTKDRADFLQYTLRTCSMQDYDNLEIIVSDDSSSDNTREIVYEAASKDKRIKYHENLLGRGMRDNFEYALSLVKPGFVIALGSDDGLLPNGIEAMKDSLLASGMEMVSWAAPLYTYPGVNDDRGQLMLYHPRKDKIVNTSEFLARQSVHLNYLGDIESPMFYVKAVVSTKLIDRVKSRSEDGRFYRCPTPDGYSGIVLAGEVSQYAFSGVPYSLYGLSPKSQGLGFLSNTEKGKKHSEAFFQSVQSVPMHEQLDSQPYSPLISIMTVDYLLSASELPGWMGPKPIIDYKRVLRAALSELAHGLYGSDRLQRELLVLKKIAARHELDDYFVSLVQGSRRKKEKSPLVGYGINSRGIYIDASKYNLKNIEQASHAVYYMQKFYSDFNLRTISEVLRNSIRYFLSSKKVGERFPNIL